LHRGVSALQAHGFVRALEVAESFREYLVSLVYNRQLVAKYDNQITYNDLKNIKLNENLITLGNIKSVLYVGFIITVSSIVCFIVEICSKEMVFMMLTP